MNKLCLVFSALAVCIFCFVITPISRAQVSRTFVSSQGKDSSSCDAPDKPCRNIASAIAKVDMGGEVVVLDSGTYEPFVVNKSATIVAAPGIHAGITAPSGRAATIVGTGIRVVLRGLVINGMGGVDTGILLLRGAVADIENTTISGFGIGVGFSGPSNPDISVKGTTIRNCSVAGIQASAHALHVEHSVISQCGNGIVFLGVSLNSVSHLFVSDTTIKESAGAGIYLSSVFGTVDASVDNCRFEQNEEAGVRATDNTKITIRDTFASGNGLAFYASPTSFGPAEMNIENCTVANNDSGILAGGISSASIVRVSNTTITNNGTGGNAGANGTLISFGNNRIAGNTLGVFFTSTVPLQ